MLKLLIADCNEDFRLALADVLQKHCQVLCCRTGNEALEILCREKPDIAVLDLMLPEVDGLTVLERAVAAGVRPKVLAFDSLLSDYVRRSAQRLGIGYIMRKPCEVQAVAARALDLGEMPIQAMTPERFVRDLLLALGIPPNHNSFAYLQPAILLKAENPKQSVTKELYPAVAKICGCEKGHVERSIRSTLEVAWKHRDEQIWQKYFPDTGRRPTNAVFISRLAEELRRVME